MTFAIKTLNAISPVGLQRLDRDLFDVGTDIADPRGILVRSADLHSMEIPESLYAVARAGAGTNNIPVEKMASLGIPVFNTPGANANAVKELVIAGMLLAARNLFHAADYTRTLVAEQGLHGKELDVQVETGKKRYAGFELPGRTLGVIGLGAIGVLVANAAHSLGLRVLGYDPALTIKNAWQLSPNVEQVTSVEELFSRSDMVTLHVPLVEGTKGLVNAERVALMPRGGVVLNFARGGVVDEAAVLAALDAGQLHAYINDFPTEAGAVHPKVVALPHLGASTGEAEDNCAVMAVDQLSDYLLHGNIRNSVNFPEVQMARTPGTTRLGIFNENKPNMIGQITAALGDAGLNVSEFTNKSKGDFAYTLVDVEGEVRDELKSQILAIDGIIRARKIA
ncbi:phosphoglycerate dehydrogenase [Ornithinimicrobium tianjinense]|uniref:D-3-phosphoglycerate dehydrogenase n=1 Tax=Ornithinimicrobium tianjinense TaxID=1195761 RepID=A0A917BKT8_9MICO|nr:phosphoglycerate dehydrogenase [Ornithinimicrobium tianjinense]GGF49753.1 D-3-phosphoglycerate dehydrogenase [Ornithinimicrobium tianjinense]